MSPFSKDKAWSLSLLSPLLSGLRLPLCWRTAATRTQHAHRCEVLLPVQHSWIPWKGLDVCLLFISEHPAISEMDKLQKKKYSLWCLPAAQRCLARSTELVTAKLWGEELTSELCLVEQPHKFPPMSQVWIWKLQDGKSQSKTFPACGYGLQQPPACDEFSGTTEVELVLWLGSVFTAGWMDTMSWSSYLEMSRVNRTGPNKSLHLKFHEQYSFHRHWPALPEMVSTMTWHWFFCPQPSRKDMVYAPGYLGKVWCFFWCYLVTVSLLLISVCLIQLEQKVVEKMSGPWGPQPIPFLREVPDAQGWGCPCMPPDLPALWLGAVGRVLAARPCPDSELNVEE